MRKFNVFGKVVDGALMPEDAPCYRINPVEAVKGVGGPNPEPRFRAVVVGCSGWTKSGAKPKYDKRFMLPASNAEVQLFKLVAKGRGFIIKSGDVSGGYNHTRMAKDIRGNSTYVKLGKRLMGVLDPEERRKYESLKDPYVILEGNLYGHELAGFIFEDWLGKQFESMGLSLASEVSTATWIYKNENEKIVGMLLRFVDDFMIAGEAKWIRSMEPQFKARMNLKGDGFHELGEFLGAVEQILPTETQQSHVIVTDMRTYVAHGVEKYRNDDGAITGRTRKVQSPMVDTIVPTESKGVIAEPLVHTGTWLYAVMKAFPAECFSVCHLARNVTTWNSNCDEALERLVRYFATNSEMVLVGFVDERDFKLRTLKLITYCDGDFASCRATRKSTVAHVHRIVGRHGTNATSHWKCRAQGGSFLSVAEVELTALFEGGKMQLMLVMMLEGLLGYDIETEIHSDSATALAAADKGFSKAMCTASRTQGARLSYVKEHIHGRMKIDTRRNCADILTKGISVEYYVKHQRFLGERPYTDITTRRCGCSCLCGQGFERTQCTNFVKREDGKLLCDECDGDQCECDCLYGCVAKMGEKEKFMHELPLEEYINAYKPKVSMNMLVPPDPSDQQRHRDVEAELGRLRARKAEIAVEIEDLESEMNCVNERLRIVEERARSHIDIGHELVKQHLESVYLPIEDIKEALALHQCLKSAGCTFKSQAYFIMKEVGEQQEERTVLNALRAWRRGSSIQGGNWFMEAINKAWQIEVLDRDDAESSVQDDDGYESVNES